MKKARGQHSDLRDLGDTRNELTSIGNKDIKYIDMKSYIPKVREPKRTLLGSYAEALCVLTGTVLFVLFWDAT